MSILGANSISCTYKKVLVKVEIHEDRHCCMGVLIICPLNEYCI
jgi:hypothetical protein